MRLKLNIAYDGAPYAGWQRQTVGDTIQARIERAVTRVTDRPTTLHGAGRTDAGVHALGQVAHCDVPPEWADRLPLLSWRRAINAHLPAAIRINSVRAVHENFHARFLAKAKIYRYEIRTTDILPPHLHNRAWHIPQAIDLEKLQAALSLYEGRHDFRALSANRGTPVRNTVRDIYEVRLATTSRGLRLTYFGSGFLYKMIRLLTASAMRVAQDREPFSWLENLLENPTGEKSRYVAPPGGLTLVRVIY